MYCSRCNGLLLEGFLQIVMYGKSLQQEGAGGHLPSNRPGVSKDQIDSGSSTCNGCQDEIQDPSVHPWGGLTTTRDGSLTLLDCYLYSKSLKGLQNVFDSARARERERELLYPDACGGGGRGWISQGITSYGRGHGPRETCALHTARLSCDTLVDFWSALGEDTRQSLLRMKEEDFIERLMFRFDSKRFCRDCRRNVIREFKELKELKRMRREPHCTGWFCVADTAFQYEVSDDTIQADWRHTFADTVGTYHHFEWAVGTGEGKSDILEFENVGMNGSVQVSGLDLGGFNACYITLRAWKLDGRCTELYVKAHALKGQHCVHCWLVVGDGYVTITRGESIRRFFEHAEEAEEEEDDDSTDKDGNEIDGECSRPQKHAKSPELAREFLLDAATVIFKEQACMSITSFTTFFAAFFQVEKAFREGTARQNAHSIFVSLGLKLLEDRVHVACKEIITLEKQMKLLEEEEKEKREEEERKEKRKTKEREKKLRRKERLKGKERDKEKTSPESNHTPVSPDVSKQDSAPNTDEEPNNLVSYWDSVSETHGTVPSRPASPDVLEDDFSNAFNSSKMQTESYNCHNEEAANVKDGTDPFMTEQSKYLRQRLKCQKDVQHHTSSKWSDRRRFGVGSESAVGVNRFDSRYHRDNFETPSRGVNGSNRQVGMTTSKPNSRSGSLKFREKFHYSGNKTSDRYDSYSCSCNPQNEYRMKVDVSTTGVGWERKSVRKSESTLDMSKPFHRGNRKGQIDSMHENCGRPKNKIITGSNSSSRDLIHSKKVWEPMELQKKYPRSNSDSDVTLSSSISKVEERNLGNVTGNSVENGSGANKTKEASTCRVGTDVGFQNRHSLETKESSYLSKSIYEEVPLHPKVASSSVTSDPILSNSSNSDNCSSCLSEGDSNTTSSNHGNLESSSTSDSEDASQQSEARESSVCIQSDSSDHREVAKEREISYGEGDALASRNMDRISPDVTENNVLENSLMKTLQSSDNGVLNVGMVSQHQEVFDPIHNPNLHFPMIQAPSTMGYYHQNSVSWPAAPASGMMPFHHPNPYLYADHFGWGLDGSSRLCMQYGALQHLPPPMVNHAPIPVYKPVANANSLNLEERSWISTPAVAQEVFNGGSTERVAPTRSHRMEGPLGGNVGQNDNPSKLQMGDTNFSLFHFDGPLSLSTGCSSNPESSDNGIVGDFSSKFSADHVENNHACNKKETTTEEYNLFSASNGLSFSFF
ncbi:hypothetical protein HS088_TW13G00239 [Tripterygium wilfordii]|uniref:Uncharacterized protein n=1 Tax=Tripterygium wilfordii TaxID=458696 RepID=A0A7J7CTE6_TRIWF|nr:hypothetical protein HS088_TW13G00239 [Tripterygium wilfordii]